MNLEAAVAGCPQLTCIIELSLLALRPSDRRCVVISDPRRLQHSLNLEDAISPTSPNMKQWDYALGWESNSSCDSCCFVEVHPAHSTGSASELVLKKRALLRWLQENCPQVLRLANTTGSRTAAAVWHWLATPAPISIRKGSQAAKKLQAAGISGPKRRLELD